MKFTYEPALQDYMRRKNKTAITVEVVTSNNSDFEVTELYVHFSDRKQAEFFKNKKHFRSWETEMGEVLLPPYRLEYDETIRFRLKKFLWFGFVAQEGIRL
ncbi:MAG: hypothetical protein IJ468_04620 [Lachnospiraceae bacterium]|nr:hypothetical protein [Lachnospiraceae bacterium]